MVIKPNESEKTLDYQKEYYKKNQQTIIQKKKDYRRINSEKLSEKARLYYETNRTKILISRKESRDTYPEKTLLALAKQRAKVRNLPFNITEEDITIPSVCPLLGIPLLRGEKKVTPNSPTIDKIEPAKGYVKGNIWVISAKANLIKNNATVDELERIITNLRNKLNDERI